MHILEPVIHYDWKDVPRKEPSGYFQCVRCKFQGTPSTFEVYGCHPADFETVFEVFMRTGKNAYTAEEMYASGAWPKKR